jgi:hypothetical protein
MQTAQPTSCLFVLEDGMILFLFVISIQLFAADQVRFLTMFQVVVCLDLQRS